MRDSKQYLWTIGLLVSIQAVYGDERLETVVVTGQRTPVATQDQSSAVSRIDGAVIGDNAHAHFNELAHHAPGTWISRGSGQEQLSAIRSPVLTGPGSCGAFLVLENSIPIRPAGFCNVNEMFEINTAQASAVEIARGPVSAVWGANGLHGAINVLIDAPTEDRIVIGGGPDDAYRARLSRTLPFNGAVLLNIDHDAGFRADSGYDQGKLNLIFGGDGQPVIHFAATRLQQETAGFVLGAEAYKDDDLRKTNPNPEAFRDADAQRLSIRWEGDWLVNAFARHSRMRFLQHFLPGQPLERNGQTSLGVSASRTQQLNDWQLHFGIDTEVARAYLTQTQDNPTQGSAFLQETRPAGTHYDYEASTGMIGLWLSATRKINPSLTLLLAGRAETLAYDYDNLAATGNLRDDGSACGFGGCLYNRPADRRDRFNDIAPRVALNGTLTPQWSWWLQAASGFRPPQATELYRLQRGQDTATLDSERLNNVELGLRYASDQLSVESLVYKMRKKNFIFRDADAMNVSDGRTVHHGIEVALRWQILDRLSLELSASQALHRYDFDRTAGGGEVIQNGNEIDTAPAHLSSSRLRWQPDNDSSVELEWLYTGSYSMNAANTVRYPGHDLVNLRYSRSLTPNWSLKLRVMNLTDTRFAERADFAFGNERYFPGRERGVYADLSWRATQ